MVTRVVPFLHVRDARAASTFYELLGFYLEWEHRFEPHLPLFLSIGTDDGARVFLSEHAGDARPDTLLYLYVDDVDGLYARLTEAGVEVAPPEDAPWAREIEVRDPDGNRLRIGTLHEG